MASADERDLWGEFARIIREAKPRWVLGENVFGLLPSEFGRFFGRILRDLAEMGYRVGWCCYPASWVGATHKRERVFIIAHAKSERWIISDIFKQAGYTSLFTQTVSETFKQDAKDNILPALHWGELDPVGGVLRNDDGISEGLDRLKCLGNAIVPQQVYPILQAITMIEQGGNE